MKKVMFNDIVKDESELEASILKKYEDDVFFQEKYQELRISFPQAKLINLIDIINNQRLCVNCLALEACKQDSHGYFLSYKDNDLVYQACRFQEEKLELEKKYQSLIYATSDQVSLAKIDDLILDSVARTNIFKHINGLLDGKTDKGLYLYGSVGSGKTFIMEALVSSYLDKEIKCAYVLLNDLYNTLRPLFFGKASFDKDHFNYVINQLKSVEVLFIDDIGSERNDMYMRDDVLFPILDYRMKYHKITHFTSNYDLASLKDHFSNTSANLREDIKGERIIERIRVLSKDFPLEVKESLRK